MLTQERLKKLLHYDQDTGVFTWLISPRNNVKSGKQAGTYDRKGYLKILYKRKLYMGHWLAWLYIYGKFPDNEIDHINGNPSDNTIANLRDVTRKQNMENKKIYKNNKSGVSGINWHKKKQRWVVRIGHFGKRISVGQFVNIEDAIVARTNAINITFTHNVKTT